MENYILNNKKILAIHNFHRKGSASGDDQVFINETKLLENNSNKVIKYTVINDEFDKYNAFGKIISTMGMLWSFKNYRNVKRICKLERPDIVHIHTFFPLLSPSILYAAKRCGCKVIVTLHDTRFICPCATSLRNGCICNECGDGHYFRMFRYGCFKNSRIKSFIVALIFKYHRLRKTFYKQIDKYICLNDNQINLLKNIGYDENKIVKKYNFVSDKLDFVKSDIDVEIPSKYIVFYGRLGEEKGIRVLMDIWDRIEIPLVVMGGGPMQEEFSAWTRGKDYIYYLGYVEHDKCINIVSNAEFVIFPSIWYEGCSMVEIETESIGRGIVATDLGFSAEAIQNGINGYKVPLGDVGGFVKIIKELWNRPDVCNMLGENARKDYEQKYRPEDNYKQLCEIYDNI